MRKFQKQQLLDIITSLHILHNEIKDMLDKKDYPTIRTAFADCQEAAIQMGEAIDQMVGTGTESVTYLEQYCERLYQLSLQLEELHTQKIYKSLESILIKAENAIAHMNVRKEVVFFPYKASMWDSLESIYLATKADVNCDAYVVPIPYYDRRLDGSIGEMHYEGNEYPSNIEIIDYRRYNLEERHPDIIYIHNPYDEWNKVTCVPERYFSKNLRNHTDCLVYIPYFILNEIELNNQKAIEGMKHFCFVPGVIYAHKVIVQSENMRQIYINEYIKEAKSLGLPANRKELEEKILGLGSPKFDKVYNTVKEDLEIPKDWLKVIEKADGTWKRIIFYNTSVSALLNHDEKMLEKMKYVFCAFKERKDELVLLWRPHPLIENTVKSMRPQLWTEYKEIADDYINEGWGIYDDTSDMNRAIALSDAYYGDYSSLLWLYRKTGKPMMVQAVNAITDSSSNIFLDILYDCIITSEKICWYNRNSIIVQDRKASNKDLDAWLYVGGSMAACEDNGKIYIAPMIRNEIIVLDLNICQMNYIELPYDSSTELFNKFYQAIKYDKYIYFLPGKYPYIIRYEISANALEKYNIDLDKTGAGSEDIIFGESCYIYDGRIFLASCNKGTICSFDMKKNQINYYNISDKGFTTICGVGNKLYLADIEGSIYSVLIESDMKQITKILEIKEERFRKSVYWNDKIILFKEKTNECIVIEAGGDEWEVIMLPEEYSNDSNSNKYGQPKFLNDILYIFDKAAKAIIVFDKNMSIKSYPIENFYDHINIKYCEQTIINENNDTEIESLKFFMENNQYISKKVEMDNMNSGSKIAKIIGE